jgi:hypothetical protein
MLAALVAWCPFPLPAIPVLDAVVVQLHSNSFNLVAICSSSSPLHVEGEIARRLIGADKMPSGANPVVSKTEYDFLLLCFSPNMQNCSDERFQVP